MKTNTLYFNGFLFQGCRIGSKIAYLLGFSLVLAQSILFALIFINKFFKDDMSVRAQDLLAAGIMEAGWLIALAGLLLGIIGIRLPMRKKALWGIIYSAIGLVGFIILALLFRGN